MPGVPVMMTMFEGSLVTLIFLLIISRSSLYESLTKILVVVTYMSTRNTSCIVNTLSSGSALSLFQKVYPMKDEMNMCKKVNALKIISMC